MKSFCLFILTLLMLAGNHNNTQAQNTASLIGKPAPDISFVNPSGKVTDINELRGKIVILDFWASWCAPCRTENATLNFLYQKYFNFEFQKASGLEIISISLDTDTSVWRKAIRNDGLKWMHHYCDGLKWNTPLARTLGIRSLPANLVINEEGMVIAVNSHGKRLVKLLSEL